MARAVRREEALEDEALLDGIGPLQGRARTVVGALARPYFRLRVTGADRVPTRGPVVLAANHESMWDVPLLVIACPRRILFMAKEELFDTTIKRWFFTSMGAFPVRRGTVPVMAVKQSLAVVAEGRVLGLFPEGTRRPGKLLPFQPGAAWLALREGVPIVPVAIRGTSLITANGSLLPRRVTPVIAFGEPMEVERERVPHVRKKKATELSLRLRAEVATLLEA